MKLTGLTFILLLLTPSFAGALTTAVEVVPALNSRVSSLEWQTFRERQVTGGFMVIAGTLALLGAAEELYQNGSALVTYAGLSAAFTGTGLWVLGKQTDFEKHARIYGGMPEWDVEDFEAKLKYGREILSDERNKLAHSRVLGTALLAAAGTTNLVIYAQNTPGGQDRTALLASGSVFALTGFAILLVDQNPWTGIPLGIMGSANLATHHFDTKSPSQDYLLASGCIGVAMSAMRFFVNQSNLYAVPAQGGAVAGLNFTF